MTHKSSLFYCSIAGVLMLSATQLLAMEESKQDELKFITQRRIDMHGGYKMAIPKVGKFTVQKVSFAKDSKTECRVLESSLTHLIREAYELNNGSVVNGATVKVYMDLKIGTGPSGEEVLFCEGGGKKCSADVEVDELYVMPQ